MKFLRGKFQMRPKKKSGLNVGFFAARSGQYNFSIKLRVMDYKKRATTTSGTGASECLGGDKSNYKWP